MRTVPKILCSASIALCSPCVAGAGPLTIELVSVAGDGTRGDLGSGFPAVSADGRQVAFSSRATTLVRTPPITPTTPSQIYLRDRTLGTTELVSIGMAGDAANGNCDHPQVSADGRYVAFICTASNLTPPPNIDAQTIYVRDRLMGTTFEPVRNVIGSPAFNYSIVYSPHYMSSDATRFAFDFESGSGSGLPFGIYALDTAAATLTELCTDATQNDPDDACDFGTIGADGGSATFVSADPDLVANDLNGFRDAFVYDLGSAAISLASVNADGSQANGDVSVPSEDWPALSGAGSLVAFNAFAATNLGGSDLPTSMLVVKDRNDGAISIASVNDDGSFGDPNGSYLPAFSDDGAKLAFQSTSARLAPRPDPTGASDAFLRDMTTGQLRRICRSDTGAFANGGCQNVAISGDGHSVAFSSSATNLVSGVVSGQGDVYIVSDDAIFDDIFWDGFEP